MPKKLVALFISMIMIVSVLSGCAGNTHDGQDGSEATSSPVTEPPEQPESDYAISGMRVNYETEPSCIEDDICFTWAIDTALRGVKQKAYRIKIAGSEEELSSGNLVWDSGTVSSDRSFCSAGDRSAELKEASRYYWNVTVTTDKGIEIVSKPSHFETALNDTGFDGASWITQKKDTIQSGMNGANWIWLLKNDKQGEVAVKTEYFRKSFTVSKKVSSAIIAYTADDYGKLYVNGELAIEAAESVGWENAQTADVTALFKDGNNTVACSAVNKQAGYGAVLVKLWIRFTDGTETVIVTDNTWKASEKGGADWYASDADESGFSKVNYVSEYGCEPWSTKVTVNYSSSAPLMRTEFTVKEGVRSAMLFASAAGLYEAYVNGEKAGTSALDPGRSEYNKRIMYQCYDVKDSLKTGKNVLAAMLGRGWYIGAYSPYGGTVPAFICKLVIEYGDGTRETVVSDGNWLFSTDSPITYNDIFNGEKYDARLENDNWNKAEYDASSWQKVEVTRASRLGIGKLVPQLSGTVKVMDTVAAKSVSKIAGKTYIYDFGQNLAGVVSVRFKAGEGTVVKLRHAEMLNDGNSGSDGPKGTLYTANLRSALATDTYTAKGDPDGESYTPVFTFHGFRYLEISGLKDALPLEDVKALVLYSDMEDTGKIVTSDELVNQLFSNTYWGQRSNFLSTPTDCPQRDERMGWSGDAQIFSGTAAYNMNVKAFFDKYITDLNDCQHDDGSYPDVAPGTWRAQYSGSGNNAWGDAGVIIPWIMYTRYGDLSYVEKYYTKMKKYARYLISTSTDYIRGRSAYGDWLSIGESTEVAVTDTAYCKYVMDLMGKMADLIGKADDAGFFRSESEKYRTAWIKKFAGTSGRLKVSTQTAYLVALAFDIIPDEEKPQYAEKLNSKIVKNGYKLTTGFIGCPLLLPVLCENGYAETAFALLQQEEYPSWKYPILQGATTIWERWNSYTIANGFGDAGMNSFNHYSYGSVTEWLYSTLVGIRCDEDNPGFSRFVLKPLAGGGITSVSGEYNSVSGTIKSSWTAESDRIVNYSCTVPGGTEATLYLSADSIGSITESGNALTDAEGITDISFENSVVKMTLGSGVYSFRIS